MAALGLDPLHFDENEHGYLHRQDNPLLTFNWLALLMPLACLDFRTAESLIPESHDHCVGNQLYW